MPQHALEPTHSAGVSGAYAHPPPSQSASPIPFHRDSTDVACHSAASHRPYASASPPHQRVPKPILRRVGDRPSGHSRGVSFTLPIEFEEKERLKARNGEIARAKAKHAAEAQVTTIPNDITPSPYPITRQQKTAYHPLTARVGPISVGTNGAPNASHGFGGHPATPTFFSHQLAADGSNAVAIKLPSGSPIASPSDGAGDHALNWDDGGIASPPPAAATRTQLGQRSCTPAAPFTNERRMYDFPVVAQPRSSPPPAEAQQHQQYPHLTHAHQPTNNIVPRLSITSMASPTSPFIDANSCDNTPLPSTASSNHALRDGSILHTRPSGLSGHGRSSSLTSRPPTIDATLARSSPPGSGPSSPSKFHRSFGSSGGIVGVSSAVGTATVVSGGGGGWSSSASAHAWAKGPTVWIRHYAYPHLQRSMRQYATLKKLRVATIIALVVITLLILLPNSMPPTTRVEHTKVDQPSISSITTASSDAVSGGGGVYSLLSLIGIGNGPALASDPSAGEPSSNAWSSCAPRDLECRVADVPYLTGPTGRRKQRVLLMVVNAGFAVMALNLICSADLVGRSDDPAEGRTFDSGEWLDGHVPRRAWLVACSDEESFQFFNTRGINAIRMNTTQTTSKSDPTASETSSIGSSAASWGESSHIAINRAKVPLLHSLLSLAIDVILIDADVILLRSLSELEWDSPNYASTDLQVMYDSPEIGMPEFGPKWNECLEQTRTHTTSTTSPPSADVDCKQVWEMNGGFFLIRANERTIDFVEDMIVWLDGRPRDHDQDAMRAILRLRAQEDRLAWSLPSGQTYPPMSATQPTPFTYRFLPQLLAPNGGVFLMGGRRQYLAASFAAGIMEPIAVHVNWIVGHLRKERIMAQYGWWLVTDAQGATIDSTTTDTTPAQCRAEQLYQQNRNSKRVERNDQSLVRVGRYESNVSPPGGLFLFTTAKPVSSFTSLPRSRPADGDGLGGYDPNLPEHAYSDAAKREYLNEQSVQLRAQAMCFRNWFALTDDANRATEERVHVGLFSHDHAHRTLAKRLHFEHFNSFTTDDFGMPMLHSLFRQAESHARRNSLSTVMYTNGDILYHPTRLARTHATIRSYGFTHFLGVGLRRNVQSKSVDTSMNAIDREELKRIQQILHSGGNEDDGDDAAPTTNDDQPDNDTPLRILSSNARGYYHRLLLQSHPYRTDALDYFMWSPGFFDWDIVPRFILGRIAYDNWILHYGNTRVRGEASHGFSNLAVIDLSETVDAIHINHGEASLKPIETSEDNQSTPNGDDDPFQRLLASNPSARSHFQPNNMINIRLGGQSSLRGLGKLEHVGYKTVRRGPTNTQQDANNESGDDDADADTIIQVVKTRPESGHIGSLYDAALEAHILVHYRPTLLVLTVDNAHVSHMKNWILHMRRAWTKGATRSRSADSNDAHRSGILVLSAGSEVTTAAKQLGVHVFELAPGERSASMLNGPSTANLQIAGLKARAIMLLLEFGYDTLLCSVSAVWSRNPFRVLSDRTHLEGGDPDDEPVAQPYQDQLTDFDLSCPSKSHPRKFADGLDLIAFKYDSTPFNVSSQVIYYRHTPVTLKLYRRMLHEVLSLVQRAALPYQVNYFNLNLDWLIQYELYQNHLSRGSSIGVSWGSLTLDSGVFDDPNLSAAYHRPPSHLSPLPHRPAGPLEDRDIIFANGWWLERHGGIGEEWAEENRNRLKQVGKWLEESQATLTSAVESDTNTIESNTRDPCRRALHCGSLTDDEFALVKSVSTVDGSIMVIPVFEVTPAESANLAQSRLNLFLARTIEIGMRIVLIATSNEIVRRALTHQHQQARFVTLYDYHDAAATSSSSSSPTTFSMKLYQLIARGFGVGLINLDTTMLFGNPFELYTNREFELAHQNNRTDGDGHHAFLRSNRLWSSASPIASQAMIQPLSALECDVHGHTTTTTASDGDNDAPNSPPNSLALDGTGWTFLYMQPTMAVRNMICELVKCIDERGATSEHEIAHIDCMKAVSSSLQLQGRLAVCPIDPYYFPSAASFFTPPVVSPASLSPPAPTNAQRFVEGAASSAHWLHISETGVYPLVVPRKHTDQRSGRTQEWAADWKERIERNRPKADIRRPSEWRRTKTDASHPIRCSSSSSKDGGRSLSPSNFRFRLRILTFDRPRSLQRLLDSLSRADFMSDSSHIELEIFVDRPEGEVATMTQENEIAAAARTAEPIGTSEAPMQLTLHQRRAQVLSLLHGLVWPHGVLRVVLHSSHVGLVGQWLRTPDPVSERDLILVLEDDMEVSPLFYTWIKGAVCTYYMAEQQFDAAMFGISLQRQHYVVGQSAKNDKYQLMRLKEEKDKNGATPIDPAGLFAFSSSIGDPLLQPIFKYQLLGTWGCLIFPQHWLAFKAWMRDNDTGRRLLAGQTSATDTRATPPSSSSSSFTPCVPHLESSLWWFAKPTKVWSQWFIRFTFEQGWYGLYPHLPSNYALARNHREVGANYHASLGARDRLLMEAPIVSETIESFRTSTSSSQQRFAFTPLAAAPLFDFHFQRVTLQTSVLRQRRALHTEKQIQRGCEAKDYTPFRNIQHE